MSNSISLKQLPKQVQSLKQKQQIMLTANMQQAIRMLQMPVLELLEVVEGELEQNPMLDYDEIKALPDEEHDPEVDQYDLEEVPLKMTENDFSALGELSEEFRDLYDESANWQMKRCSREDQERHLYQMSLIQYEPTLFEELNQQTSELVADRSQREMVYILIGYLNRQGILDTPPKEIADFHGFNLEELLEAILVLQTFDPPGVGARSLQETLAIQLKRLGKRYTLAYEIVVHCFEDMLNNRIPNVAHQLKVSPSQVYTSIHEDLLPLSFHPGNAFQNDAAIPIVADLVIEQDGDKLTVNANSGELPTLRLRKEYFDLLENKELKKEDREFIVQKFLSAKWFLRNLHHRGNTLERIGEYLIKNQRAFFLEAEGELIPLTMKTVAEELDVHESTVSRAVSNKYIFTPRGMYPLVYFFSQGLRSDSGDDIAANSAKELLLEIIKRENKRRPHSDQALMKEMAERGVHCARRTIAKYRSLLNIGNRQQRRQYLSS